jgi:hypothetical protein
MEVGGQRHASAALPPGNTWHSLYTRLGGTQWPDGRVWKVRAPPGFDPRTVQPVTSRYTDCAIPTNFERYVLNPSHHSLFSLR